MRGLFWLSDQQWAAIEPHLPYYAAGKRRQDDRRIISGIVHVLQSGCRWQDCPPAYGPSTTVYNRYNRWSQHGYWQYLFAALTEILAGTSEQVFVHTTHVKAHRCAGGGKEGPLLRLSAAPRAGETPRSMP
jgi:transposase